MLNRKQCFIDTLSGKTPEKILVDFFGCPLSGATDGVVKKISDFLGISGRNDVGRDDLGAPLGELPFGINPQISEKILKYYEIDTRGVGWIFRPEKSLFKQIDDITFTDEWGVVRKFTGRYWDIVGSPLKDATLSELKKFPFPDPSTVKREEIELVKKQAKWLKENTDYLICASHPCFGILELGCWMCGFDDFLYRLGCEPEFVTLFFDRVLEYQKEVSRIYYGAIGEYIDYTSSGDDFGTQESSFMSPAMFDEFIFPYMKERISYTKKFTKAKFLHHSCGNVSNLIPSLMKAGVEILNPIQPVSEGMSPAALKKNYGGKNITFHGGFDTQSILPFGTKEEIENKVKELIETMGKGVRYIFAAAHCLQDDVPAENIDTMFKAAKKYSCLSNK